MLEKSEFLTHNVASTDSASSTFSWTDREKIIMLMIHW